MMSLAAYVYSALSSGRNALYEQGVLKVHRLEGPVISVGNLSVGGSGKTPFVILLGELLKEAGLKFDVLSRGYGRKTKGVLQVNPDGMASEFGDEPLLIARSLKVPVFVGASRFEAGLMAEREVGAQLHILDDGFQHRALARDLDIVLLNQTDLTDGMIPAGRLREPLSSLSRASVVVLSEDLPETFRSSLETSMWRVHRGFQTSDIPSPAIAFCGIARPDRFFSELKEAGVKCAAHLAFRDHYQYMQRDADRLLKLRAQHPTANFVTTEKDAINLGELSRQLDPLTVVKVKMELDRPADVLDTVLRVISERRQRT